MKKFIYLIFLIIILLVTFATLYLSIVGIETSKFNNLIIKEIEKKDSKINLELEKIKIQLDIKKIQLLITTINPEVLYENIKIPIKEIKIFTKISKILKSKSEVSQIDFTIKKFKIKDFQKVATRIKPSNVKTFLLNNLSGGEIKKALISLNTDKDFKIIDYKVSGVVKKITAKIKNNFTIKDISFNFAVDNSLTLINSINASYEGILVSNGSINLQQKKNIEVKGKFKTQFSLKEDQLIKFFKKEKFFKENKINVKGTLLHEFNLKTNKSLKVVDYNYKSSGNISQSKIILKNNFKKIFFEKPIKKIIFKNTKIDFELNKKNKNLLLFEGLYSTDSLNYKKFNIKNNFNKKKQTYFIDLNLGINFFFDIINFKTDSKKQSNIKSEFTIKNNKFFFKTIDFTENKNFISIKGLVLNKESKVKSLTNVKLSTFNKKKENNNFKINFGKKIFISGKKYDSTHLLKVLASNNKSDSLINFNSEIEIKLKKLITKSKMNLNNFNLIGLVEKGKFNKILAKGEFTEGNYLDISLKKDINNKKILEVYSDLPQAVLGDYKFFEGIREGKLLFNSISDNAGSVSKLKIENFKVTQAPTFATLLTLADLGGFADLVSGQGMSFDILEINFRDNDNLTTVEEILALGTSLSLQMDGYVEKKTGLVSLNGALVPAKTLNNLVSKIPVVGNILIGDKVGEGVFGVSFKIKGLPGQIKTIVNPVKTVTPRFIIRALEKRKKQ